MASAPSDTSTSSLVLGLLADVSALVLWVCILFVNQYETASRSSLLVFLGLLLGWNVLIAASRWLAVRKASPEARQRVRRTAIASTVIGVGSWVAALVLAGPRLLG